VRRLAAALIGAALALGGASAAIASPVPVPFEGSVRDVRVHAGSGGTASVTWSEYRLGAQAATLGSDGWAWADPEAARPAEPEPDLPAFVSAGGLARAFAVNGGGHAVVVWRNRLDHTTMRFRTQAADRLPDGTWSAPYDMGPPGADVTPCLLPAYGYCPDEKPAVALDAAGNAIASWVSEQEPPDGPVVLWSARPAGGSWSAPVPLGGAWSVRLAMSPSGEALATWIAGGRLRWATRPPGGAFGPSGDVGPAIPSFKESSVPRLTIDAEGRALAVWSGSQTQLLAATRPPGGAWSAPVDLTALEKPAPPDPPVVEPPVVKPPLLEAVDLSRTTLRRSVPTVLRFRLGSAGEVKVIVQRRGRGKAVRGLKIAAGAGEHRIRLFASRPLPPGRYTVRVRVSAEGQAPVAAAKQLVVRPA
jgi:hypothetical protein